MDLPIAETQLTRLTLEQVKGLMPNIQSLWDEVDQRNKSMRLDPDFDIYEELEDLNRWFFYLARYEDSNSFYSFFVSLISGMNLNKNVKLVEEMLYLIWQLGGKCIQTVLNNSFLVQNRGKLFSLSTFLFSFNNFRSWG